MEVRILADFSLSMRAFFGKVNLSLDILSGAGFLRKVWRASTKSPMAEATFSPNPSISSGFCVALFLVYGGHD